MNIKIKSKISVLVALTVLIGMILLFIGMNGSNSNDQKEDYTVINTKYCDLNYPTQYIDNLYHLESTEGNATLEVFYFMQEDKRIELFRILFDDANTGQLIGYLKNENRYIPVTFKTSNHELGDFEDEESWKLFSLMMNGINDVIESIQKNENFTESSEGQNFKAQDNKLMYWTLSLPSNIIAEETVQVNTYIVTFYGELDSKRIPLYTIHVGENQVESVLGYYSIDGKKEVVSVESYDLPDEGTLSDEDRNNLYRMMDTINDVIRVIMNDKNYSNE